MPVIRVSHGVYIVGGANLSYYWDSNSYIIICRNTCLLIDVGTGKGYLNLINNIFELGVELKIIKFILLTHCHYPNAGGAHILKELTGALTVAHYPDSLYMRIGDQILTDAVSYNEKFTSVPISVELTLTEHDVIDNEEMYVKAIHTPGHTPGSTSYLVHMKEYDTRILFIGDALGPLSRKWMSDENDWHNSINRLLKYEFDILCTSTTCIYSNISKLLENAVKSKPVWVD